MGEREEEKVRREHKGKSLSSNKGFPLQQERDFKDRERQQGM
jgi:hypothetical protein